MDEPTTKPRRKRIDWSDESIPVVTIVRQRPRCEVCGEILTLERSKQHDGFTQGRAVCEACGAPNHVIALEEPEDF